MKRLFYITPFLLGLLFPAFSFSQINNDYSVEGVQSLINHSIINHSISTRGEDDLLLAIRTDDWDSNIWTGRDSIEYYYDANNNRTLHVRQTWDGSSWVNNYEATYEYDTSNNLTLSSSQTWDGSSWSNSFQGTYEYDDNKNQTLYLTQIWDGNNWVNYYQGTSEYDTNNNQTFILQQYWDGSSWVNEDRTFYYYQINTSTTNLDLLDFSFNTFPNPCKGNFTIDLGKIDIADGNVLIYNSIGQLVYSQAIQNGNNTIPIKLFGLSVGTYFIQIIAGDKYAVQPILISR